MKLFDIHYKKFNLIALLISLSTLSIFIALGWTEIIDDSYIFFRYVYNLVEGNGYTYNVGESVEAATSLTWPLLLSLFYKAGISPEISVRILGYLSGLLIVFITWSELRSQKISKEIILVALFLLVTNRNFYSSIMMGLETGLYSLFIFCFYKVSKKFTKGKKHQIVFALLGVLCFLTRPEFLMIVFLSALGILFLKFENKKASPISILIMFSGLIITGLWRHNTFGSILPNSIISKSVLIPSLTRPMILLPRLVDGGVYIFKWAFASVLFIVPIMLEYKYFLKQRSFQMFVAAVMVVTGFSAVLINSGDWMPFSRLLVPYMPLYTILMAISLNNIISEKKYANKNIKIALLISLVFIILQNLPTLFSGSVFKCEIWPEGQRYKRVGELIKPVVNNKTVIAPEGIGIIGNELRDVKIFDFYGLTEPYIAKHGVIPRARYTFGKHHYQYTMKNSPDIFLFHSELGNHIPYLNKWGYSNLYQTFSLDEEQVKFTIGIKNDFADSVISLLENEFTIKHIDTDSIRRNSAAVWPLGEK